MHRQLEIPEEDTIVKYFEPKSKKNPKDYLITDLIHSLFSDDSEFDSSRDYFMIYGLNRDKKLVLYAIDKDDTDYGEGLVDRMEIISSKKEGEYVHYPFSHTEIPDISNLKAKGFRINDSNIELCKSDDMVQKMDALYKNMIEDGDYIYEQKGPLEMVIMAPMNMLRMNKSNAESKIKTYAFYAMSVKDNKHAGFIFNSDPAKASDNSSIVVEV